MATSAAIAGQAAPFNLKRWLAARHDTRTRVVSAVLIVCGVLLFAGTIYRAANYPFTHDESTSYADYVLIDAPFLEVSANNHPLNSLFMRAGYHWFGPRPLGLRFASILAHALYLVSTWLCLQRFRSNVLRVAGFALLDLNPYVLDFFFLARGYGLALGLQALSLYALVRSYELRRGGMGFAFHLCTCMGAATLAVLANFTFLNFYLPLLFVCTWLALSDVRLRRFSRRHLGVAFGVLASSALFLAILVPALFRLQRAGHFFAGGDQGFIADTIDSLLSSVLYDASYADRLRERLRAVVITSFIGLLVLGLALVAARGRITLFSLLVTVLGLAVALPVAQHVLVGTLYPLDRMALYYLPLYALTLVVALDQLRQRVQATIAQLLAFGLGALLIYHFKSTYDPATCHNWGYDRHDEQALALIERDRVQHFGNSRIHLGNGWMHEPSLNYYRILHDYRWLSPVRRHSVDDRHNQYVYSYTGDVAHLRERFEQVAAFRDTGTVLLRAR